MELFLWLFGAYILGSVPAGYLLARLLKGIDIRTHGSGNVGATNVFRVIGPAAGIATLVFDFLKGFMPVFLAFRHFGENSPFVVLAVGVCAIAGHIWTVFLGFRGGKGVATGAGVFLALLPLPMIFTVGVFILVFALTRFVSLGSICASLSLPLFSFLLKQPVPFTVCAAVVAIMIVVRHRSNIKNLLAGTERKTNLFLKRTGIQP